MRRRALLLAMVLALAAAACSDKPSATLSESAPSPLGGFTPQLASVPIGVVVGFSAQVNGGSNDGVSASVDDDTRVTVTPTTTPGQFVLVGLAAGRTTLHVGVKGTETNTVPVEVSAQPPPSGVPGGASSNGDSIGASPCSSTPGPSSASFQCRTASDCYPGQVCCVLGLGSACMIGPCPPTPWGIPAQLCASSAECGDGGTCASLSVPGLMTCSPVDAGGGPSSEAGD